MTVDTKEIVTTIGYMIGVKKNILEQCFGEEYHELLQTLYVNKETSIIRYLCKLRTTLMQKFKKTDDEMRFNLKNLNSMDFYDQDNIKQLEKWGFEIIKPNYRSEKYMLDLAGLISANIDNCFELFPDWVNWNYIKDLFVIPQYTKKGVLKSEFNIYMKNIEYYPFQILQNTRTLTAKQKIIYMILLTAATKRQLQSTAKIRTYISCTAF